jgi:putative DNA primase/helicase
MDSLHAFAAFLQSLGFIIDAEKMKIDGIFHSVKVKRKGARLGSQTRYSGSYCFYPETGVGLYKKWNETIECQVWYNKEKKYVLPTPDELAEIRRIQEQRHLEDLANKEKASADAQAYFNKLPPLSDSNPYLARKLLSLVGTKNLRADGDILVVPVMIKNRLLSLQSIFPDGSKRFFKGAPTKGGAFFIRRLGSRIIVICEGIATGLAIFQLVPDCSVLVAFSAGNLIALAERIKQTTKPGEYDFVFCADNDHETAKAKGINPGIDAAKKAAKLLGAGVVWPEGIEGTDYADALIEWGAAAPFRIRQEILQGAKYVP